MQSVMTSDGRVIVRNLEVAQGFWKKLLGLMFRRDLDKDYGLAIVPCKAVHCCFMFGPIDVLFMSADGEVVHVIEGMKPWTFSPYVKKARYVLECKSGTVKRFKVQVGQKLLIHPNEMMK